MKTLLQIAAALALISIGAGAAVLANDLHKTLAHVDAIVMQLDAEKTEFDTVLLRIGTAADQLQLAAIEQRGYWQKTSADSDKTVKALRLVVDRAGLLLKHTDEQLNTSLLPDVDREVVLTSQSAQMNLDSMGHAADALTFQINDLQPIIANAGSASHDLAIAAGYFSDASFHFDNTLKSVDHTVAYYDKKLTTPASFTRTLVNGLLDVGSKAGNIVSGFVK